MSRGSNCRRDNLPRRAPSTPENRARSSGSPADHHSCAHHRRWPEWAPCRKDHEPGGGSSCSGEGLLGSCRASARGRGRSYPRELSARSSPPSLACSIPADPMHSPSDQPWPAGVLRPAASGVQSEAAILSPNQDARSSTEAPSIPAGTCPSPPARTSATIPDSHGAVCAAKANRGESVRSMRARRLREASTFQQKAEFLREHTALKRLTRRWNCHGGFPDTLRRIMNKNDLWKARRGA